MQYKPPPSAITLMGPTASGKTALAMQLCDALPCEIISVDSALVYRGMDIGTAKPEAACLARYPHVLINLCDPSEAYSAGRFLQDVDREMRRIHAAGHIPLLVGGTMLYFHLLQQGCARLPAADPAVRRQLAEEAAQVGWPALHAKLQACDPVSGSRINPNDKQRISRALEIHLLTGGIPSQLQAERITASDWAFYQMAIWPEDRGLLHQCIETRFHSMLKAGWLEEVKALHARENLHADLPAMRMVGYRQLWAYLDGHIPYARAVEKGIVATRQLAKRQLTWLRSWPGLHRLPLGVAGNVVVKAVRDALDARPIV